jgi:hypothetical protein
MLPALFLYKTFHVYYENSIYGRTFGFAAFEHSVLERSRFHAKDR